MTKLKEDARARIARAYVIDLVKNATTLSDSEDKTLLKAIEILSSHTIPPLDD